MKRSAAYPDHFAADAALVGRWPAFAICWRLKRAAVVRSGVGHA